MKNHYLFVSRFLSVLLALCFLLSLAPYALADDDPPSETSEAIILGDVDGNGTVNAADARLTLRAAVRLEQYAEDSREFRAANYNRDEYIAANDARMVLRTAVGLEPLYRIWPDLSVSEIKPQDPLSAPLVQVCLPDGDVDVPVELVYMQTNGVIADGILMFTPLEEYARNQTLPSVEYADGYHVRFAVAPGTTCSESLTVYRDTGNSLEKVEAADVSALQPGVYLMDYSYALRGNGGSATYAALFWLRVVPAERGVGMPEVWVSHGSDIEKMPVELVYKRENGMIADGILMFTSLWKYVQSKELPVIPYDAGYDVSCTVQNGVSASQRLTVYRDTGSELEKVEAADVSALQPGVYLMCYGYELKRGTSSAFYEALFWLQVG